MLIFATAGATIWTLLDRKRGHHAKLHEWLRVLIRIGLGLNMIMYGAAKLIPSQMPAPSLERLLQPFGDASPMGLLWTFIGASAGYSIFAGAAEMLGGLLLMARRTTLLGALLCIGALGNVVILNFCYDVPVKVFASHLLAMAVFLILPDWHRLASLLLFNRRADAAEIRPLFARAWLNFAGLILRTVVFIGFTAVSLFGSYNLHQMYSTRSALHGIWNAVEFEVDGEVRPPLLTDAVRWRRVVCDYPGTVSIHLMDDARQHYALQLDTNAATLTLTRFDDPTFRSVLSYKEPETGLLVLEGRFGSRHIRATFRRADESQFRLTNRGFHWINEAPFNR